MSSKELKESLQSVKATFESDRKAEQVDMLMQIIESHAKGKG